MKTFNHNKLANAAIAMLGIVFFASAAHADDVNSITVRYSDLNVNTAVGAKVLYQRIRTAAEQVCDYVDGRQMERAAAAKVCLDQAIENSVRAVSSAQLTHVASSHGYGSRGTVAVASAQ